jgi:putative NIF3 family GTP cyclohydrolase 1 type 2
MTDWLADFAGPGTKRPILPHESSPQAGAGRVIELDVPIDLQTALARAKAHLGLKCLRVAQAQTTKITRVAVCPGAGGSLFEKVGPVDLLITGEMRHHDVLSRKAQGTHVILTDHTNTERGYLPLFAQKLRQGCPGLNVIVSETDADPLSVV